MKLNPFNKKSSAYYDKVKAEHDQLSRQLAAINKELVEAEAQHAKERDKQTRLRDAASAKAGELPAAIRDAERTFIHCRAVVTEIEFYEQLLPMMNVAARASAARREISYRHDETRFEIEIPRELLEIAQAALATEIPTT